MLVHGCAWLHILVYGGAPSCTLFHGCAKSCDLVHGGANSSIAVRDGAWWCMAVQPCAWLCTVVHGYTSSNTSSLVHGCAWLHIYSGAHSCTLLHGCANLSNISIVVHGCASISMAVCLRLWLCKLVHPCASLRTRSCAWLHTPMHTHPPSCVTAHSCISMHAHIARQPHTQALTPICTHSHTLLSFTFARSRTALPEMLAHACAPTEPCTLLPGCLFTAEQRRSKTVMGGGGVGRRRHPHPIHLCTAALCTARTPGMGGGGTAVPHREACPEWGPHAVTRGSGSGGGGGSMGSPCPQRGSSMGGVWGWGAILVALCPQHCAMQ